METITRPRDPSGSALTDSEKLQAIKRKLSREFREVCARENMNKVRLRSSKTTISTMREYYRGYCSCIRELKVYLDKLEG
jgi:hypothetical protein